MPHSAVVTFTARPLGEIVADRGSRDWRLDPERARQAEYLICTQNRHSQGFRTPTAPHGAAFLIGRIAGVVRSPERPERWLITISEYIALDPPVPNIWGKSGNLRYPVWYTSLEALGIDLSELPPFIPLPPAPARAGAIGGMAEMPIRPVIAPANWTQPDARGAILTDDPDAWRRLDAILAQLDRVPDLPAPMDPLEWDEHGLPR
jgi:hypothetical protein